MKINKIKSIFSKSIRTKLGKIESSKNTTNHLLINIKKPRLNINNNIGLPFFGRKLYINTSIGIIRKIKTALKYDIILL